MPDLNCDSCIETFTTPDHSNSSICSLKADHLSNFISLSNSINDSNLSVLKNNTLLINTDILKRSSSDVNTVPDVRKYPKMLKEIEDCGLDISTVISRTRRSGSISELETRSGANTESLVRLECRADSLAAGNTDGDQTEAASQTSDKENVCDAEDEPTKEAEQSATDVSETSVSKCGILNEKLTLEFVDVPLLPEHPDSSCYRTDEIDRMAKSLNKLSFTCKECSAEFETVSQFKTHQVLHEFESHKTIRVWSPVVESGSATDYISSSETLSEYKSPVKKQSLKRRKIDYEARISDFDPNESQEDMKSEECLLITYENRKSAKSSGQKPNSTDTKPEAASKGRYKCDNCSKALSSSCAVRRHKLTACKNRNISDLKEWVAVNNIPEFGCGICGVGFEEFDKLQIHRTNDHQNFQMPQKKCC